MKVELVLKTITPLHIGNGESITPLEFLYDKEEKRIHIYNFDSIVEGLKKRNLLLPFSSRLKRTPRHKETLTLDKILSENPLLRKAFREIQPAYSIPAEIKFDKDKNIEIEAFTKVSGNVYVPGSELKGSLRRALLLHVLERDDDIYSETIGKLKGLLDAYQESEKKDEKYAGKLLKKEMKNLSAYLENRVFRGGRRNAQWDVMKFIKFSDSECLPPEDVLRIRAIKVFYINGKDSKNFAIYSETIDPEKEFRGITLSVDKTILEKGYYRCHPIIKEILSSGPQRLLDVWGNVERKILKIDKELVNLIGGKKTTVNIT